MQNPHTGNMESLSGEQLKKLREDEFHFSTGEKAPKDTPVFTVGERLMVKRCYFEVREIEEDGIFLRSVKKPVKVKVAKLSVPYGSMEKYYHQCTRCKRDIMKDFEFCPYCGVPLDQNE